MATGPFASVSRDAKTPEPPNLPSCWPRNPNPPAPGKSPRKKAASFIKAHGSITIVEDPWALEIRDASGKLLTKTQHLKDNRSLRNTDPLPFCFQRPTPEYARRFAATFCLAKDEKIYGCGESFTRLNKRGQKVVLWAYDAHGVQHDGMYKPVPFFMSNRGYGMFLHTSSPATLISAIPTAKPPPFSLATRNWTCLSSWEIPRKFFPNTRTLLAEAPSRPSGPSGFG